MIRVLVALLMFLATAAPVGAAWTDRDVYVELTAREWVTADIDGTVNRVVFEGLNPETLVGVAVRSFYVDGPFGQTLEKIPMLFWIESRLLVIPGEPMNYFVMGAGGWLWRVTKDSQTIEPVPP